MALVWIGGICSAALLSQQGFDISIYPDWAIEPLKIGAFCGFIGAAIAKLPVCEPRDIKDKML